MVHHEIVALLLGILLLAAGRRLFWLFVGAIGFTYGLGFAPHVFQGASELTALLIALLCGVLGAILGIFAQKAAVCLAGALIGGYLASELVFGPHWHGQHLVALPFLLGAVLGGVLLIVVFEAALILISSLAGGFLIAQALHLAHGANFVLVMVLTAVGCAIQGHHQRRHRAALAANTEPPVGPP